MLPMINTIPHYTINNKLLLIINYKDVSGNFPLILIKIE